MSEAIYLQDSTPLPSVKVHPTAIMNILNSYTRRADLQTRVIGTLMGIIKEGNIEILDCYTVPHSEKEDEQYVAINKDYHKSMLSARRHISRREVIVGWFSSTTAEGGVIIDNSSLIHDFYSRECADPVHLVVDTTLSGDSVGVRAFVSVPMVAGPYSFANMFHEVKADIEMSPLEAVGISQMVRGQKEAANPWSSSTIISSISSPEQALTASTKKMLAVMDEIIHYVTEVAEGRMEAKADIGMMLADTLSSSGLVRVEDFQSVFQAKTQDMLMVNYLATLIQNQLAIAEKLQQII